MTDRTDIVERLNARAIKAADLHQLISDPIKSHEALCEAEDWQLAASTIEDLRAALEAMTGSFERLVNETDDEFTFGDLEIITAARAALSKSRGET